MSVPYSDMVSDPDDHSYTRIRCESFEWSGEPCWRTEDLAVVELPDGTAALLCPEHRDDRDGPLWWDGPSA